MLAPLATVMIEGNFGRIAHQFRQRFDGASHALAPITGQHAVSKRVAAGITGVGFPQGIVIPAEFAFDFPKAGATGDFLPSAALRIAKDNGPGITRGGGNQMPSQFRDLRSHRDLSCLLGY